MARLEDSLPPGETLIFVCRWHWSRYAAPFIAMIVCLFLAGIALALSGVIASSVNDLFASDDSTHQIAEGVASQRQVVSIIGLVVIVTPLLSVIWYAVLKNLDRFDEMIVTTKQVLERKGRFTSITKSLTLFRVEYVQVEQTFFGRLLGFGHVYVKSGGGQTELDWGPNLSDPVGFRTAVVGAKTAHT
jgi:uncharacterized membrane protein YdbT with pleckstrin-like domain